MRTDYSAKDTIKNILRALKTQQFKKSNWKMGKRHKHLKRIYRKDIQLSGQQKLKTALKIPPFAYQNEYNF